MVEMDNAVVYKDGGQQMNGFVGKLNQKRSKF
jgi:hypothetical protein